MYGDITNECLWIVLSFSDEYRADQSKCSLSVQLCSYTLIHAMAFMKLDRMCAFCLGNRSSSNINGHSL